MDASTFKNLSKGQQIAAGGGLAALIATFLPWYSISSTFGGFSVKGTDFGFGWMGMFLFVAAAAITSAPAFGKAIGNDQVKGEQIALVAAGLGGVMWFYRLVSAPLGVNRGIGLYLAVAAGAAVLAGIVMHMKEKGIAMPSADTFKAAKSAVADATQQQAGQQGVPQPAVQHPAPQAAPAAQAAPQAAPAPTAAPQHAAPAPQAGPAPQEF